MIRKFNFDFIKNLKETKLSKQNNIETNVKEFANIISMLHDGDLMHRRQQGFAVIDIGLRTIDKGFGMLYEIERLVIAL